MSLDRRDFLGTLLIGGVGYPESLAGGILAADGLVSNVRDREFGARGDGRADDTAAIQAAVSSGMVAVVPRGVYLIDGTIFLTAGTQLHLMKGAQLVRPAEGSEAPLISLVGNDARLTGAGEVSSGAPSPSGVVRVGALEADRPVDINWTHIDGITISGNGDERSLALDFFSTEPVVGGSNYQCNVRNLKITTAGTGVRLSKWCNAHTFTNLFFYRIGRVVWEFESCMECTVFGGFVHFSHNVTCVDLRGCQFVQFYGFQAEPGGERAVYYRIAEDNLRCAVLGYGNCSSAPVNESASTLIMDLGALQVPQLLGGSISATSVRAESIDATSLRATSLQIPPGGLIQSADSARGEVRSRTAGVFVLSDPSHEGFRINGLARASDKPVRAGAFYEVTISGYAVQGDGKPRVYQGRWLVTPYNQADGRRGLSVGEALKPQQVVAKAAPEAPELVLRLNGFRGCRAGEVVCEVRECGLPVAEVAIEPLG